MPRSTNVYVVDDDEAIRHALTFQLQSAGFNPRAYSSALAFLADCDDLPVGCVVTDVRMPDVDGLELVRRLHQKKVRHVAIVISCHGDIPLAVEAMRAGAVNFIEKPFEGAVLINAIRAALQAGQELAESDEAMDAFRRVFAGFTPREVEVFRCILDGKTNKVIAREFGLSPRTVEVHRAKVMLKSGVKSVSELVRMAISAGL